ncbi:hypothetical protein BCR33DRAFT_419164 [Rhizoclosmatium globosum]|uniref:Uncharacterized protein n=1 Tax=Rhizoclosmatium globosum TaxID=329046 RepID=A0A1Y2BWP8_9FUNG|nr:hypothetical protein BCR33DRAFT_419164 [Rhizoclosmatium globosum]|eukprot:ORY39173.1 hypothetical protein BCR33DRAFT_419164 [Rhizoclosmatium globosum]
MTMDATSCYQDEHYRSTLSLHDRFLLMDLHLPRCIDTWQPNHTPRDPIILVTIVFRQRRAKRLTCLASFFSLAILLVLPTKGDRNLALIHRKQPKKTSTSHSIRNAATTIRYDLSGLIPARYTGVIQQHPFVVIYSHSSSDNDSRFSRITTRICVLRIQSLVGRVPPPTEHGRENREKDIHNAGETLLQLGTHTYKCFRIPLYQRQRHYIVGNNVERISCEKNGGDEIVKTGKGIERVGGVGCCTCAV